MRYLNTHTQKKRWTHLEKRARKKQKSDDIANEEKDKRSKREANKLERKEGL